jgi:hypothetical protein
MPWFFMLAEGKTRLFRVCVARRAKRSSAVAKVPPYYLKMKAERVNLTFRQRIAALARRTWSLVSEQQLLYHAEWFRLYYHLARPHETLREPISGLKGKYRARTPAMALGLTDRVMTVGDLLCPPLIPTAA